MYPNNKLRSRLQHITATEVSHVFSRTGTSSIRYVRSVLLAIDLTAIEHTALGAEDCSRSSASSVNDRLVRLASEVRDTHAVYFLPGDGKFVVGVGVGLLLQDLLTIR